MTATCLGKEALWAVPELQFKVVNLLYEYGKPSTCSVVCAGICSTDKSTCEPESETCKISSDDAKKP